MSTLVFPQLATGALCQFPIQKVRRTRTVVNHAADGSEIKLSDPAGEVTEWLLKLADLTDQEAAGLRSFFAAAEGSLNGFTFVDPAGNLLEWSEQLDEPVWQKDPFLSVTSGAPDPLGSTRAWTLSNSGAAGQSLAQTLAVPGEYRYCLSAYVRCDGGATVDLSMGAQTSEYTVGPAWMRIALATAGVAEAESLRFGITVSAGSAMSVYGLQVEAQGAASVYKATSRGGVYDDAHFGSDELALTCTAPGRNACTLSIIHANHI
jgi:hypothetical protein